MIIDGRIISLVEILLSLPELFFVFNFPTILFKVSGVTWAKIKSSSVSGPRKLSKFMLEGVIVIDPANSGLMPAKKLKLKLFQVPL